MTTAEKPGWLATVVNLTGGTACQSQTVGPKLAKEYSVADGWVINLS